MRWLITLVLMLLNMGCAVWMLCMGSPGIACLNSAVAGVLLYQLLTHEWER